MHRVTEMKELERVMGPYCKTRFTGRQKGEHFVKNTVFLDRAGCMNLRGERSLAVCYGMWMILVVIGILGSKGGRG